MATKNYQVTWYGQVVHPAVATLAEAEEVHKQELAKYQQDCELGWCTTFNEDAVQINTTNKKAGSY